MAALDLLRRPDVMAHLADWRAGQMLGARTRAAVGSSSAVAVVSVPRTDPAWYVRGGAAVERLWLTAELHGLAVQPVSPVFLYAIDDKDLLRLGGERHVETIYGLSQRFHDFWDLDDGEEATLLLRLSHAPPPSTRSARLPLQRASQPRARNGMKRSDCTPPAYGVAGVTSPALVAVQYLWSGIGAGESSYTQ